MKNSIYFLFLWVGSACCWSACRMTKRPPARAAVAVVPKEPALTSFFCGFPLGTYEGHIPCFGNDCDDAGGAPLTRLVFSSGGVEKILTGTAVNRHIQARWTIASDCVLTIRYAAPEKIEYYRWEEGHLLRLSAAGSVFGGKLSNNYILHYIKK